MCLTLIHIFVQGYELLHSLHTPDGVPMDEDAKHVHFHDFSEVSCTICESKFEYHKINLPNFV